MASPISDRRRAAIEKTLAEKGRLERMGLVLTGNACSEVLVVKGEAGPAETCGAGLMSGADGPALRAALLRLGYAPESWAGMATWKEDGSQLDPDLLRQAVAALDPACLILADQAATDACRMAYAGELSALEDFNEAMLEPGYVAHVLGMRIISLGGFEAALGDAHEKQVVWAYLKRVPAEESPY